MILDYLRRSSDNSIEIPPFHTGHLGFIPGTDVFVSLMQPFDKDESHCELCATPFSQNLGSLCRLECTMRDQVGVVHRLIRAIASLHVNVVKEESSAINYLNHHQVDLVLDWRTSPYNKEFRPTPVEVRSRYSDLQCRIPL